MARLRAMASSHGPRAPRPGSNACTLIPHAQKRLLQQVLGHVRVANNRHDHRLRQPAEPVVEVRHGVGIAPLQAYRELFVVLRAHLQREKNSGYGHATIL